MIAYFSVSTTVTTTTAVTCKSFSFVAEVQLIICFDISLATTSTSELDWYFFYLIISEQYYSNNSSYHYDKNDNNNWNYL